MFKFYQELSFEESIDHRQPDWSPDNYHSYRQWYEEDIRGQDILVVTVGDSWTWGDHLGNIDWEKNTNDPVRLQQIYGRLLSKKLNADWVNLARPGCSNYWMLEKLQDIRPCLERARDQYKQIHVIVTLTEDLRESTYSRRINVDTPYQEFLHNSESLKDFLMKVEQYLFDNLDQYFDQMPFVSAVYSRAFTDIWPANRSHARLLDKTWCDVIQDKINYPQYLKTTPFIAQLSIDPLTKKFLPALDGQRQLNFKEEFVDMMDSVVARRWNFLGESDYNLKGSTYHPNPQGHAIWAKYVYNQLV
jgi:hypothetical protein